MECAGSSDSTRGIWMGGFFAASCIINEIDYITIASTQEMQLTLVI